VGLSTGSGGMGGGFRAGGKYLSEIRVRGRLTGRCLICIGRRLRQPGCCSGERRIAFGLVATFWEGALKVIGRDIENTSVDLAEGPMQNLEASWSRGKHDEDVV
jgi:hypothetical protein